MFEKVEINSERWLDSILLKNEIWKDIVGYEGLYQISNYGRVKSIIYLKQKIKIKIRKTQIFKNKQCKCMQSLSRKIQTNEWIHMEIF